jgi:hypothetical protein
MSSVVRSPRGTRFRRRRCSPSRVSFERRRARGRRRGGGGATDPRPKATCPTAHHATRIAPRRRQGVVVAPWLDRRDRAERGSADEANAGANSRLIRKKVERSPRMPQAARAAR